MTAYEPIMDGFFTVALSFVALHGIHRKGRFLEIAGLSSIPLIIDADHLLPQYAQGIKAFHSIFLISLVSLSILSIGYLKKSRRLERIGVAAYAVAVISISVDLMEGGKISFLYPISTQEYVIGAGSPTQPALYVIALLVIVRSLSYFLEGSFLPEGTVFKGEPHTGQAS